MASVASLRGTVRASVSLGQVCFSATPLSQAQLGNYGIPSSGVRFQLAAHTRNTEHPQAQSKSRLFTEKPSLCLLRTARSNIKLPLPLFWQVVDTKWPLPSSLPSAEAVQQVEQDRSGLAAGRVPLQEQGEQPSQAILKTWQSTRAVLFNLSSVLDISGLLKALAANKSIGYESIEVTEEFKGNKESQEAALVALFAAGKCTASDVEECLVARSKSSLFPQGLVHLLSALETHGISSNLSAPAELSTVAQLLATLLEIPLDNVFAAAPRPPKGLPGEQQGWPQSYELSGSIDGRVSALRNLRQRHPYTGITVVGSSAADFAAAIGADLLIALEGSRPVPGLAQLADWTIRDFSQLTENLRHHQVAFIGSGAWASAAAKLAAENVRKPGRKDLFKSDVRMWVFEEMVEGRKLSELINERHENVKYLPGIKLPENLVACADLEAVAKDATILVVCTPHQFVYNICKELRGKVDPSAVAVSLTKGMRVRPEGPQLISEMVRRTLGVDCSVLMGANIAEEVAKEQLSEGTIGYHISENGQLFKKLFESEYYICSLVPDVAGAEMAGTLKNVVALGAGFVDGLDGGANPKATIIRNGLIEIKRLSQAIYPTVRGETSLESCGIADLVASCYGGRNRKVAEAYVRCILQGRPKSFQELEEELLKGQKLQGALTSEEVQQVLEARGWQSDFPLFLVINSIVKGSLHPSEIFRFKGAASKILDEAK